MPPLETDLPRLISVPPGTIHLVDEGTRRSWDAVIGGFSLGATPVTRAQYFAVTKPDVVGALDGTLDGTLDDATRPVTDVSWNDAVAYCNALSREAGFQPCYSQLGDREAIDVACDFTANGFRLPTEAEWEFACRAGSSDARYGDLDAIAWQAANAGGQAHPVGQLEANAFALHDMLGNVWEWCWDFFDVEKYGGYRVFRGGGFDDEPRACRASCRRKSHPTFAIDDLGFRIARTH